MSIINELKGIWFLFCYFYNNFIENFVNVNNSLDIVSIFDVEFCVVMLDSDLVYSKLLVDDFLEWRRFNGGGVIL